MTSCPAACTALVYLTKFSIACSAPYLFRLCRSYCGQALQEFCVINLISNWAEGEEAQQPRRSSAFLPRDLLHLPGLQQCEVWSVPTIMQYYINLRVRVQPDTNTYQIQQEFKALYDVEMICPPWYVKLCSEMYKTGLILRVPWLFIVIWSVSAMQYFDLVFKY